MDGRIGTLYGFSIYSTFLKQHLGYDQFQIGFVGAAGNVGIYTGGPIGKKKTLSLSPLHLQDSFTSLSITKLNWTQLNSTQLLMNRTHPNQPNNIGMFFDRFGPKITVIFAGALLFMGYFGAYCAVLGWMPHNYFLLALFFFLVGQVSTNYSSQSSLSIEVKLINQSIKLTYKGIAWNLHLMHWNERLEFGISQHRKGKGLKVGGR